MYMYTGLEQGLRGAGQEIGERLRAGVEQGLRDAGREVGGRIEDLGLRAGSEIGTGINNGKMPVTE